MSNEIYPDFLKNKKIIIWGTDKTARNIIKKYNFNTLLYVDNDKRKQNSSFMGKTVYSPEKLKGLTRGNIFIIIASSFYFEISFQLKDMGFKEKIDFDHFSVIEYFGNKYYCPCCESYFQKFLSFGINKRLNAKCPKCYSLERHRLLWLYFLNKTNLFTEKLKVLHFAPEYAFQQKLKNSLNIDYISADINSSKAMIKMDITGIPCKNSGFDVIICSHVLEHIQDDKKALKELYRVLKPDGWATIQVPVDKNRKTTFEDKNIKSPEERRILYGQEDHVRIYGLDYKTRLEQAGFKVNVSDYVKSFTPKQIRKYGFNGSENIYHCVK